MSRDYDALKAELYATADANTKAALDRKVAKPSTNDCTCGPTIQGLALSYHNGPSCLRFQSWRDDVRIDRALAANERAPAGMPLGRASG